MKKKKKTYEKTISVSFFIHSKASDEEMERYHAAVTVFGISLFTKEIGDWCGRETSILEPEDGFYGCNIYYVLESRIEDAKKEIERIITNFNIQSFTKIETGEPIESEKDYNKLLKKKKSFEWAWIK